VITIRTIDAHVAGAPLRLIVDGFPSPRGQTMGEKQAWAARRADDVRRLLMLEPRGHVDMFGAVFTEATQPGSDAGLLIMGHDGFHTMSGHAVIAAATIALERGLLVARDDSRIVLDTVAGRIKVNVQRGGSHASTRVVGVTYANVPAFVVHPGADVPLPGRRLRADVAFGGEFYAIVDAESAGVPVDGASIDGLRKIGGAIAAAIDDGLSVTHPMDRSIAGIAGTVFTAAPQAAGADLRSATVYAGGSVDRSPGGTAMAAVMAVLDAMGMLSQDGRLRLESITGQIFEGRLAGRTQVGAADAVVVEVSGAAYITGEHTFSVSDGDPFGEGFSLRP
jgi:trans-L-3-hydroxyproline dehydratase